MSSGCVWYEARSRIFSSSVGQPQPGYHEVFAISQHSWIRQSTPWLQRIRFSQGRVSPEITMLRPPPSKR